MACSCFPLFYGKCSCHLQNWVFFVCLKNLLQKNVVVLFFGNQISKWRSFEKKGLFLTYFSHFLVTGKSEKIPSAHISNTYTHVYCSPYWLFCLTNFEKKKYEFISHGFSLVWVLVLILIGTIWEQSGPQWLLWLALLRPLYVLSCSSFASSSLLLQNQLHAFLADLYRAH